MRSFVLPSVILGLALAIGAFAIYGRLTRPDAPAQVQALVQQYTAPGVKIGATVAEVKAKVPFTFMWVPHVGYVTHPSDKSGVSELRLLLSAKDRERPPNDKASVEAVEVLTATPDASATLFQELTIKFRRPPREGCMSVGGNDYHREVRYWTSPSDNGGAALITDYGGDRVARRAQVVVSFVAWGGKFDGGRTIRSTFSTETCARLGDGSLAPRKDQVATVAALDSLTVAFGDLAAGEAAAGMAARARAAPPSTVIGGAAGPALAAIDPCIDAVRSDNFTRVSTPLVDLYIPKDFDAERFVGDARERAAGYGRYSWRGADNSVIAIYGTPYGRAHDVQPMAIMKECDLAAPGSRLHVDIGMIGSSQVVRGVFVYPTGRSLVVEGHAQSPERVAEALHTVRTVSVSPRWNAQP